MAENSGVSYVDHSFSPWIGCTHKSPGCLHCCAESLMDKYLRKVEWGPRAMRVKTSEDYWKKPLHWNKTTWYECGACGWRGSNVLTNPDEGPLGIPYRCPKCGDDVVQPSRQRVLVLLCDPFEVNDQVYNWQCQFFRLLGETPNLDWILLTKNPENISPWATDWTGKIFDLWWADNLHVNLGISVENQKYAEERVGIMMKNYYPFILSVAPMLGPVDLLRAAGGKEKTFKRLCKWVICEGESGKDFRTLDIAWAQDLRAQCQELGIPFYMKQDSGLKPERQGRLPDDLWNCKEFPF